MGGEGPNWNSNPEHNPEQNQEQTHEEHQNRGAGVLSEISFADAKREGEVPEGVRDEKDYREYLAEQEAKNKEHENAKAEEMERINTFEKRLEMNSPLYDKLANVRAFVIALCPDARALGSGQGALYLPGSDYSGWKEGINDRDRNAYSFAESGIGEVPVALLRDKEALSDYTKKMSVAYLFRSTMELMSILQKGVTSDTQGELSVHSCEHLIDSKTGAMTEVAIDEKSAERFEKAARGYAMDMSTIKDEGENWKALENVGYTREEIDAAMKKAEYLMNGDRYECEMDSFLQKSDEHVRANDIRSVEETMRKLNNDTGRHMFSFERDGFYGGDWADGDGFVPDMKTRFRLEEKIVESKEKIFKTIERAYREEYEDITKHSRQGREVLERIRNE